jgi:hypothetical protein
LGPHGLVPTTRSAAVATLLSNTSKTRLASILCDITLMILISQVCEFEWKYQVRTNIPTMKDTL